MPKASFAYRPGGALMENQEFDPESAYGRGFAAGVLTHAASQLRLVIRLLEQLPSADREIHHRLGAALFDLEELLGA